jgi:hypothetical protein
MPEIIVVGSVKAEPGKEDEDLLEGLCGDEAAIVRYVEVPAGERTMGSLSAHAGA